MLHNHLLEYEIKNIVKLISCSEFFKKNNLIK